MKLPKIHSVSRLELTAAAAALLANCAAQQVSTPRYGSAGPKEYFPSGAKYGAASPRVVSDGQSVPKGGGKYHVGRSYRVAGRTYSPRENPNYSQTGIASYYGSAFHGRKTANGEIFDRHAVSAAHPTMPLPSYARVTNLANGRSIIVRVNDRGPFHGGRIIDLSERTAHVLGTRASGTGQVRVDYVGRASTAGSNDRSLMATLREGGPAPAPDGVGESRTLIAAAPQPTPNPQQFSAQQFSAQQTARPPVIALTTVARPAAPAPLPPVQAAAVTQAAADDIDHAAPRRVQSAVPFPPDRPMDLGAPRRAPSALGFAPLPAAPLPPARPLAGNVSQPQGQMAALYYAQPSSPLSRFGAKGDPLARINTRNITPLRAAYSQNLLAGMFKERANADRLAAAIGAGAKVASLDGGLFRVTAGPFVSSAEADSARARALKAGAAGARLAP